MSISEEEKDQIFHPQPNEEEEEVIEGPAPEAGFGYHATWDGENRVRLFDNCGVEIEYEREPDYFDPHKVVESNLSPAQRQWLDEWEDHIQPKKSEEEKPEPSYLQEIRETKLQCDHCGKTESLETASCLGGVERGGETYAEFGCNCGNVIGIDPHDLPPRYLKRAADDEDALIEVINDIGWRRKMGLE